MAAHLSYRDIGKVRAKYCGLAACDMTAYLECRSNIAMGLHSDHYIGLKGYYRRMFLSAPFRKGFK